MSGSLFLCVSLSFSFSLSVFLSLFPLHPCCQGSLLETAPVATKFWIYSCTNQIQLLTQTRHDGPNGNENWTSEKFYRWDWIKYRNYALSGWSFFSIFFDGEIGLLEISVCLSQSPEMRRGGAGCHAELVIKWRSCHKHVRRFEPRSLRPVKHSH